MPCGARPGALPLDSTTFEKVDETFNGALLTHFNLHSTTETYKEERNMTPKELAVLAAKALDARKGEEIKIMEVTELTTLADYFVICTGGSNTQINALCDAVEEQLETQAGEKPLHREGHRGGIWVLLDYGCLVVHVFNSEAREFYGLERLWSDGKPLDVAALLAE